MTRSSSPGTPSARSAGRRTFGGSSARRRTSRWISAGVQIGPSRAWFPTRRSVYRIVAWRLASTCRRIWNWRPFAPLHGPCFPTSWRQPRCCWSASGKEVGPGDAVHGVVAEFYPRVHASASLSHPPLPLGPTAAIAARRGEDASPGCWPCRLTSDELSGWKARRHRAGGTLSPAADRHVRPGTLDMAGVRFRPSSVSKTVASAGPADCRSPAVAGRLQ